MKYLLNFQQLLIKRKPELYKIFLALECVVIFIGIPLVFYFELVSFPKIPVLVIVTAFCVIVLLRDPSFKREQFWKNNEIRTPLQPILLRFLPLSLLLTLLVTLVDPSMLFIFLRRRPIIWLIVMLLYPLLSAYPQELIYRAFFFHRYKPLISNERVMIYTSACVFAFLHIMYDNILALILTLLGGYLFSTTYHKTHSLLITSIEHALYGNLIFTIGLGSYFFEGY
jgi:membrane protease YdiL (CAAX protease family)